MPTRSPSTARKSPQGTGIGPKRTSADQGGWEDRTCTCSDAEIFLGRDGADPQRAIDLSAHGDWERNRNPGRRQRLGGDARDWQCGAWEDGVKRLPPLSEHEHILDAGSWTVLICSAHMSFSACRRQRGLSLKGFWVLVRIADAGFPWGGTFGTFLKGGHCLLRFAWEDEIDCLQLAPHGQLASGFRQTLPAQFSCSSGILQLDGFGCFCGQWLRWDDTITLLDTDSIALTTYSCPRVCSSFSLPIDGDSAQLSSCRLFSDLRIRDDTTVLVDTDGDAFWSPFLSLSSSETHDQLLLADEEQAAMVALVMVLYDAEDATITSPGTDVNMTLLYLQQLLTAWALSFMAMFLVAHLRLLFYRIGLRGGQRNADPLLRSCRHICRGASFAFLMTAFLMPVALGVPVGEMGRHGTTSQNFVDLALEAQLAAAADETTRRVEHDASLALDPDFTRPPPEPGDGADVAGFSEDIRECRVAIRVMLFQQINQFATMWVNTETEPGELIKRIQRSIVQDEDAFSVIAAAPQLSDDIITVMVVPKWWSRMEKVGIIFDQTELGGAAFAGAVPCSSTLTDIFVAFGSPPPDGLGFYLQNCRDPLPRSCRFSVPAGSVIRLAYQRVAMPYLAEALTDLYWTRDLDMACLQLRHRTSSCW